MLCSSAHYPLSYSHYLTVATLQSLPYSHYLTVATIQSLPYSRYLSVTTLQSLPYSCYLTVATSQSLPYSRYLTVATLQSLPYSHCLTVATILHQYELNFTLIKLNKIFVYKCLATCDAVSYSVSPPAQKYCHAYSWYPHKHREV
jgi:hypothetical protein